MAGDKAKRTGPLRKANREKQMCKGPSRIGCLGSGVSRNFPRVKAEKRAGVPSSFSSSRHLRRRGRSR